MDKKKKKTDGKKLIIAFLILNFVLVLGLGGFVTYRLTKRPSEPDSGQTATPDVLPDKKGSSEVDALIQSADNSMANVYSLLIQGTSFEVEGGLTFTFGTEGEFSGYFDEENPNVKNYKYKVLVGNDNNYKLYIYNFDTGVEYDMIFNPEGDVVLTDKVNNRTYVLKY